MSPANPHLYAIVAGELSGDTLGAGLMMAIKRIDPQAMFMGIGGPKMNRLGMRSLADIRVLSVMGISEVASHVLPILRVRRNVARNIINSRPCCMVGIDSPDFNLSLERKVRATGIPTVHYVSPSVWAWRQGRMKKIRASCDEVLCLLKFEKEFFDKCGMRAEYVGHTLASAIPLDMDMEKSRERIDFYRTSVEKVQKHVCGILPGSRVGVISRMLPVYCQTARLIKKQIPDTVFVTSVPTYELAVLVKDIWLENSPDLSLTVYVGCTRDVIASCNAVMLTSGTIALEAMLVNRPFCVAYRVSAVTAAVGRRMLKVNVYSLPNLIAGSRIVREFIQEDCTPEALSAEMIKLLSSENLIMKHQFRKLHEQMRMPSDDIAAKAVTSLARTCMEQDKLKEGQSVQSDEPQRVSPAFRNDIEPSVTLPDPDALAGMSDKSEPGFGNVKAGSPQVAENVPASEDDKGSDTQRDIAK